MKIKRQQVNTQILTLLTLILALLLLAPGVMPAAAGEIATVDRPGAEAATLAGLTAGEQATIRDLIREAEYQFTWQVSDGVWAYHAPNRAHDLSLSLAADGFHAARYSATGEPLWDVTLCLAAYGEQALPAAIAEDRLVGSRERVEYHWSRDVVEWYTNSANGVEHGLTLAAPPAGADGSTVELTFSLRGSLTPELDSDGRTLRLKDASGQTALHYDQLAVYDATGRSLPAYFSLSPGREGELLYITIDAAGAAYPLTVDPLFHDQAAKLTASDTEDGDQFGHSVAISGDTVVVGAFGEDGVGTDRGAAYVFTRNEGGSPDGWGEVTKMSAAPLKDGALFGYSVAISGDTVVVGASGEDDVGVGGCVSGENCGAVYVFERNKNGTDMWGQVHRMTAGTNAEENASFGNSVAIDGDTITVGAYREDGAGTDRGAAYVFERNHGGADTWGRVSRMVASPVQDEMFFGSSVGISSDTIVVGARRVTGSGTDRGAAYIFNRNEPYTNGWGQVTMLTASDSEDGDQFGYSAGISGDTVVVGAPYEDGAGSSRGAAYVFERNQGGADNWGQKAKVTASDAWNADYFGYSVAISGDTVVVGAEQQDGAALASGSAYLFERNQGGADHWGQVTKLTASDAAQADYFGRSVAISGNTVVVGAPYEDGDGALNSNRGAAYLFAGGGGEWQEIAIPHASDAADDDHFGIAVAISGDTAVVGADWEEGDTGTDRGSAYVIERNWDGGDGWGEVEKLLSLDRASEDYFGRSVAISGDTIVIGAWGDNGGSVDRGAAYIFERNYYASDPNTPLPDNWGQVAMLTASDPGNEDYFGFSVAISGDTVVVGARGEQGTTGSDRGAAYVFTRNKGGGNSWGEIKKLLASDAEDGDNFGYSVAISGDTVVVGAYGEDGAGTDRGAAYVFERNYNPNNPGTPWAENWGELAKLEASYPEDEDRFGYSVAISNDTIIVGAYLEDGLGGDDPGAAYIFERNKGGGDDWGLVKKLSASDAIDNDYFGVSVGISGDTVIVGAHGVGILFASDRGAAYVFERNQGGIADNWGQVTKLRASDAANYDYFGRSVSISGNKALVGAYSADGGGSNRGAAYVFYLQRPVHTTYLPLVIRNN